MIRFEVCNASDTDIDTSAIKKGIDRAQTKLGNIGDCLVVVEFVSKDEIQHLNQSLRGINEPTDIISIASQETTVGEQTITTGPKGELSFKLTQTQPINSRPILGQIVLCPEVIAENADASGQSFALELEWVIEHGIYHLMGFHHGSD